ncbi:MAG: hypothetical protein MPF33_08760 [Candidatus Aramenus sp.]|jgi:hypothetical protein|nr:hypothetical protein [Candidatus Aramenus sp.]
MEITVYYKGNQIEIKDKIVTLMGGTARYEIGRAVYYVLKALYSIPRLYGSPPKGDVIDSWKNSFEREMSRLITSEIEVEKIVFPEATIRVEFKKLAVNVALNQRQFSVNVELKERLNAENSLAGLIKVDSFYFDSIEKVRPFVVLGNRSGLIAAFNRFLILRNEGAPGIPKTLGVISEFVNSIVLMEGSVYDFYGRKITTSPEGLVLDGSLLYNADPETLSLFPLKFLLEGSKGFFVIEDPEANLSKENKEKVKELILGNPSTFLISTNDEDFALGKVFRVPQS